MLGLIANSTLCAIAMAAGLAIGLTPIEPEETKPPDQAVAELNLLAVPRIIDGTPVGALIMKPTLGVAVPGKVGGDDKKAVIVAPSWFLAIKYDEYYRQLFGAINDDGGTLDMPAIYQSLKARVEDDQSLSSKYMVTDLFVQQFDYFTMNELRTPIEIGVGG